MPKQNKKDLTTVSYAPLSIVVFPHMILHFDVGRLKSIKSIEEAMLNEQIIFLTSQKDPNTEDPDFDEINTFGTIAHIKQLLRLPGDTIRVLVEGVQRAKIINFVADEPFYKVDVMQVNSKALQSGRSDIQALCRQVIDHFETYAKLSGKISPDATLSITNINDLSRLPDVIASNLGISIELKPMILEELSPKRRLEKLLDILQKRMKF